MRLDEIDTIDDRASGASTAVDTFTFMLTNGGHIARVSEHSRVGGDLLVDDVTIEISLLRLDERACALMPDAAPVAVPILIAKPSSWRSSRPMTKPITGWFSFRGGWSTGCWLGPFVDSSRRSMCRRKDAPTPAQNVIVYQLVALVCNTEPIAAEEFATRYDAILSSTTSPQPGKDPRQLRDFCAYFAANTISAIEAPRGTDVIYVSYRTVSANDRTDTFHERLRTRFRVTHNRYHIPLNFPSRRQSMSCGSSAQIHTFCARTTSVRRPRSSRPCNAG
ncbi:hypothetical protein ACIA5C_47980 [Actinoplanes sp. NPDC051343]|uniref:hypothetical protein n=1 Tax=Actinoplanes sp. NPDC051343 TaxID=3363906 RepID=UPI00378BA20F